MPFTQNGAFWVNRRSYSGAVVGEVVLVFSAVSWSRFVCLCLVFCGIAASIRAPDAYRIRSGVIL